MSNEIVEAQKEDLQRIFDRIDDFVPLTTFSDEEFLWWWERLGDRHLRFCNGFRKSDLGSHHCGHPPGRNLKYISKALFRGLTGSFLIPLYSVLKLQKKTGKKVKMNWRSLRRLSREISGNQLKEVLNLEALIKDVGQHVKVSPEDKPYFEQILSLFLQDKNETIL